MSQARSGGDHPGCPINLGALALRVAAFVFSVAVMLSAAIASAQPPIGVEACEKITKAGFYNVDVPTLSPTSGDCLVISSSNVTIDLNRAAITGLGAGAGVHVMPTASNVFIEGQDATITGFADGIEIDGSKATAEHFNANNNLNAGVLLNNARQSTISNLTANNNALDGVRMAKGTQNTIQQLTAYNNGRFGVWLLSTTRNNIGGFDIKDSVTAGIYVGCWGGATPGPQTPPAPCKPNVPPSSFNQIFNGSTVRSTSGSEIYGIAVDLGDNGNRVANVRSTMNNLVDLFDGNQDCGSNIWFVVTFDNSFPTASCIP